MLLNSRKIKSLVANNDKNLLYFTFTVVINFLCNNRPFEFSFSSNRWDCTGQNRQECGG